VAAITFAEQTRTRAHEGFAEDAATPVDHPQTEEVEVEMAEDRENRGDGQELEFGSKTCKCPKCGVVVPHMDRGKPCSSRACPKCGSMMKGEQCQE
jgi:hypothetical protein